MSFLHRVGLIALRVISVAPIRADVAFASCRIVRVPCDRFPQDHVVRFYLCRWFHAEVSCSYTPSTVTSVHSKEDNRRVCHLQASFLRFFWRVVRLYRILHQGVATAVHFVNTRQGGGRIQVRFSGLAGVLEYDGEDADHSICSCCIVRGSYNPHFLHRSQDAMARLRVRRNLPSRVIFRLAPCGVEVRVPPRVEVTSIRSAWQAIRRKGLLPRELRFVHEIYGHVLDYSLGTNERQVTSFRGTRRLLRNLTIKRVAKVAIQAQLLQRRVLHWGQRYPRGRSRRCPPGACLAPFRGLFIFHAIPYHASAFRAGIQRYTFLP